MTYERDEDEARMPPERRDTMQRLINFGGLAVSLALIAGMSVWGYKLLVRDVEGVPVVQALEGAFRTQPEDPGGMTAQHQGLQVNEIAADGSADGTPDEVTLAPAPESFAEEDAAMGDLAAEEQARETAALAPQETPAPSGWPDEVAMAEPEAPVAETPEDELATDRAVAEALSAPDEGTAPEAGDPGTVAFVSPRPAPRPASLGPSGAPEATAPPAQEVAPATLDEGTRMVQLGAYLDAEVARDQWAEIGARFPGEFQGKRRVIQQAESGGRTFYRLRVEGFEDVAASRRFCAALTSRNTDCIPVELR